MKKTVLLLACLLAIAGCAPNYDSEEEVVQDNTEDPQEDQKFIVPNKVDENQYQTILPYKPSAARGVINRQVANRVDIDELETGLTRHAKSVFSPEKYLFQEGQYLTANMVYSWIDELNPPKKNGAPRTYYEENPRVFSHILEQDFLVRGEGNRVELGGIAIGIALKSEYAYQTEIGGPTFYKNISQEQMMTIGRDVTEKILQKIRNNEELEELKEVPVFFALFRQGETNDIVPGNFVAKTFVEAGSTAIGDWEKINEEHVLFPSDEATSDFPEESEILDEFKDGVQTYFPNYVGVIGKGFYIDEELSELTINIPVEFNGKQEIVGFTQHIYGLIIEHFPTHFDVQVTVESPKRQEALITREAGEDEPFVYIYH